MAGDILMSLGLIIKCEQGLRLGVKGDMAGIIDAVFGPGGRSFQSVSVVSDSALLDYFSLKVHHYKIIREGKSRVNCQRSLKESRNCRLRRPG